MISFDMRRVGFAVLAVSILLIVVLVLIKLDEDKKDVFLCESVSADPTLDMEDCPVHNSNSSWLIVAAFVVAFLVLGAGIYMIAMPKTETVDKEEPKAEEPIEYKSIDVSKLDDEEKRVYELLQAKEGSVYQSDLIKDTGFSKVQVTRILDKMEGKKILERRRRGMTNIVILK